MIVRYNLVTLMNETSAIQSFPCNECQAGVMSLHSITYFTWVGDELVMVPNFPGWVCDMCGKREYDSRAVNWMTTLLSPNAQHDTRSVKRIRSTVNRKRNLTRPASSE